jgi:predicted GIY-YIG superfamily endonuclease
MVYLIHLNEKFKGCQHYIGFTENLEARLKHHHSGTGARFLKAVKEAGIDFGVSRTWPEGDRKLERRLKNWKKVRQLCPICIEKERKEKKEC